MRGKRVAAALLTVALASCGKRDTPQPSGTPVPDLETAAISAGVIAGPGSTDISGLFARDTDRICIVPSTLDFRIGVFVDYGDDQSCSGGGKVTRAGETLHVALDGAADCAFDARFEGDRIVFPGRLPSGCEKLCSQRASLAALDVRRLSDSVAEAKTLRNARGKLLCEP